MQFIVQSTDAVMSLFGDLGPEDEFADNVERRFAERVREVEDLVSRCVPVRLAETSRLAYFPLAQAGEVELLILIAIAGRKGAGEGTPPNEMSRVVQDAWPLLEEIANLGLLGAAFAAGPEAPLGSLLLGVQGSEIAMHNSSYPDALQTTTLEMLDDAAEIRAGLEAELGFTASDALSVLGACHAIQTRKLNERGEQLATSLSGLEVSPEHAFDAMAGTAAAVLMSVFEPSAQDCAVGVDELTAETGLFRGARRTSGHVLYG